MSNMNKMGLQVVKWFFDCEKLLSYPFSIKTGLKCLVPQLKYYRPCIVAIPIFFLIMFFPTSTDQQIISSIFTVVKSIFGFYSILFVTFCHIYLSAYLCTLVTCSAT